MTATNFLRPTLPFTLFEEAGFVDDPQDPGGATLDGVTLARWREWTRDPTATVASLQAMTPAQRTALYGADWNSIRANDLPGGVDLMAFDHHVTSGLEAVRVLQQVVGLQGSSVDGWVGDETLAAVAAVDVSRLVPRLLPQGVRAFQAAAGLRVDGQVGPLTTASLKARPEAALVAALVDAQAAFYRTCKNFARFGRGWEARVARRGAAGMALAVAK